MKKSLACLMAISFLTGCTGFHTICREVTPERMALMQSTISDLAEQYQKQRQIWNKDPKPEVEQAMRSIQAAILAAEAVLSTWCPQEEGI